jgi:hypothetical protein
MKISDLVRIGSALNLGVNISFGASKVSDTGALDVLKDKIRKTEELVLDKDVSFANKKGQ